MLKLRQGIAVAGPDGSSSGWYDLGDTLDWAALNAGAAPGVETVIGIVQPVNTILSGGANNQDQVAAGTPVQNLYGTRVVMLAALAAQANLNLVINVYRGGAKLGGDAVFGWKSGGGGTPAFVAFTPVALPAILTNAQVVQPASGGAYVPLQAGD